MAGAKDIPGHLGGYSDIQFYCVIFMFLTRLYCVCGGNIFITYKCILCLENKWCIQEMLVSFEHTPDIFD